MGWLLLVSFVWAFSFGLIKGRLAGLDPVAVAAIRMAIASLIFLPWIRYRALGPASIARLALVGALQFGVMYVVYLKAFAYLQAYEVALFTIFTPLYLTFFDAVLERRWRVRFLGAAALAAAGAGVALWQRRPDSALLIGFSLIQLSNLCFAAGQVWYRRIRPRFPASIGDKHAFGWLCLGATATALLASLAAAPWTAFRPTGSQWLVLLYLGGVASGLGFFLWNLGATRVNAGVLAVFNNAKIPLGIACSLLFFGESAEPFRLLASFALLGAALWLVTCPVAIPKS